MIICISNNKGGVLKTTLATNIACELAKEHKVCLIDLDGQSNIANTFKTSREINKGLDFTITDFLVNKATLKDVIDQDINEYFKKNNINNLNIIYSDYLLNEYDRNLLSNKVKNGTIKKLLDNLNKIYDYVVIDTAPMINTLTALAISESDRLLIPFEPDKYAINGLMNIVKMLKNNFKNKQRKIFAVATKFNRRNRLHNEYLALIESYMNSVSDPKIELLPTQISYSTKSSLIVASENVPLIYAKSKSELVNRLKQEIIDITKNIVE